MRNGMPEGPMNGEEVHLPPEPVRNLEPTCGIEKECYPPRMEILRNNEVSIQFFSVGCVIRVGCKSVGFNNVEEAMKELNEYVANPRESVKKWNKVFNVNE